jgi:hypothetical protein
VQDFTYFCKSTLSAMKQPPFPPLLSLIRNYRLVVMRERTNDPQLDLFEGEKFHYRCILTNDRESSEKEVIEYYNRRGASEKTFDIQNNDFG